MAKGKKDKKSKKSKKAKEIEVIAKDLAQRKAVRNAKKAKGAKDKVVAAKAVEVVTPKASGTPAPTASSSGGTVRYPLSSRQPTR